MNFLAPIHCRLIAEPRESLIPQVSTSRTVTPDLHESALWGTHYTLSAGSQSRGSRRQGPRQQMEECVWSRGRSSFTTDTHREQLTAPSLPSVSGDVLHTKPLCPPPKRHTAVPEGWILCLSSLPLPALLSRTPPPSSFTLPLSQTDLCMSVCIFTTFHSIFLYFSFSFVLVFVTRSISKQSLIPSTQTGPPVLSKCTAVLQVQKRCTSLH